MTTYKLGVWYSTSPFADQRFDTTGGLLANPAGSGLARTHSGDWAFYGIIDQMVWQRPEAKDQGIGVFLQVMAGPSDRTNPQQFVHRRRDEFPRPVHRAAGRRFRCWRRLSRHQPGGAQLQPRPGVLRPRGRALRQQRDRPGGDLYGADHQLADPAARSPGGVQSQRAGIPGEFPARAPLSDAVVIGMRATFKLYAWRPSLRVPHASSRNLSSDRCTEPGMGCPISDRSINHAVLNSLVAFLDTRRAGGTRSMAVQRKPAAGCAALLLALRIGGGLMRTNDESYDRFRGWCGSPRSPVDGGPYCRSARYSLLFPVLRTRTVGMSDTWS